MKQYDMLLERSGADTPRIKEVWEYKKVNSNETLNESELNKIGKEGWQLCTAIGLVMSPGNTYYYIYYFKRIKP